MSGLKAEDGGAANTKGRSRTEIERRVRDADIESMINAKVGQAVYLLVERWKQSDLMPR